MSCLQERPVAPASSKPPRYCKMLQYLPRDTLWNAHLLAKPRTTAVITLLVSPDDAQRLTLASSEGHIQLSLRNPLDTKQDEVPPSTRGASSRACQLRP